MRVIVSITAGCPELAAHLETQPPRARAERLRLLATLGLATLHGGLAASRMSDGTVDKPASDQEAQQRYQLLARLGASLNRQEG
ncbi:MAG: hypothetical protein U1F76_14445 [Candidatus Competibacteraceae bacterium]